MRKHYVKPTPLWQLHAASAVQATVAGLALAAVVGTVPVVQEMETGRAPHRPSLIVMTPQDKLDYPTCVPVESAPKLLTRYVLVIELDGSRTILTMGAAFDRIAESKTDDTRSIWVIGKCKKLPPPGRN